MDQRLIDWLEANESRLVEEWRQRFRINSPSLTRETGEFICKKIPEFFHHLLKVSKEILPGEIPPLQKPLPHFDPAGHRLKLPVLVEIQLSGEETLRDHLFIDHPGRPPFSDQECAAFFEEIHNLFRGLMEKQVPAFCNECLKPMVAKNRRLFKKINHNAGRPAICPASKV